MRHYRTTLSISLALLVAIFGCATERPTRPSTRIEPLPAIPLSSDPVLWSSPMIDALRIDDSTFRVDVDSIIRSHEFHQLELRVVWRRGSCADNIDLWNPLVSEWEFIERHDVPYGCVPEKSPGNRMISDLGINPASLLTATTNVLTFRRDRNRWIKCQVLDLDNRYQRIAVPYLTYVGAMAWNGNLYIATRTMPYPEGIYDSLRVYSRDGTLVRVTPLPFFPVSMTWCPEGLWMMHDYHPVVFSLCDSSGTVSREFTYPADKCDSWASSIRSGVVWFRDQLLVYDECDSMIYLIDPPASIEQGHAVMSDSIGFSEASRHIASDGRLIFSITSVLNAYTPRGRLIFQLPAPSAPHCSVWDGEALWVAHRGCGAAKSEDNVISRFLLQ